MTSPDSAPRSACSYPIVIIEHTLRGGLYGLLAGAVMASGPSKLVKIAKTTVLGAGWCYLAEYSRCAINEMLPWTSESSQTAWVPGAIAGFVSGSTVATAYRPFLPPAQVAAFTAFSTMTYAMNSYAEWLSQYESYQKSKEHHHAFHGAPERG